MQQLMFEDAGRYTWRDAADPEITDGQQALVRPLMVACCDLDVGVARAYLIRQDGHDEPDLRLRRRERRSEVDDRGRWDQRGELEEPGSEQPGSEPQHHGAGFRSEERERHLCEAGGIRTKTPPASPVTCSRRPTHWRPARPGPGSARR